MKRFLQLLGGLGLGVVIYFGFRHLTVTQVPVAPAIRGEVVNAVTGTVEIFANLDLEIKAEAFGVINARPVDRGDLVEDGDVIATQESTDLELRLEQAQIRLNAAEARRSTPHPGTFDLKTIQLEREALSLAVELQQAPANELERLLRQEERASASLRRAEIGEEESVDFLRAEVARLEFERDQRITRAPFAGRVAEIFAWPGDQLNRGNRVIRLIAPGRYLTLTLSEEDFSGVAVGQQATIRLASYPARTFSGQVSALAAFADSDAKTRQVFLFVQGDDETLIPGLTGEAYLVKDTRENALFIPRRALIGRTVFVVKGDRVERREVVPGYLSIQRAEILKGLQEGDQVVLEGQTNLRDGDRIQALSRG